MKTNIANIIIIIFFSIIFLTIEILPLVSWIITGEWQLFVVVQILFNLPIILGWAIKEATKITYYNKNTGEWEEIIAD